MAIIRRVTSLTLAVSVVLLATSTEARAQARKSDSVVKIKAEAEKPNTDGTTNVLLSLTIDKGWHIYANPVGQEDLAENATTVTADGSAKVEAVEYPDGKPYKDKSLGTYKVYEDQVKIRLKVKRPASGPTDLNVKLSACNDSRCLVPAVVKVNVP
jgi:DsbC/DsbD-like thiol-disulfide interchange protein